MQDRGGEDVIGTLFFFNERKSRRTVYCALSGVRGRECVRCTYQQPLLLKWIVPEFLRIPLHVHVHACTSYLSITVKDSNSIMLMPHNSIVVNVQFQYLKLAMCVRPLPPPPLAVWDSKLFVDLVLSVNLSAIWATDSLALLCLKKFLKIYTTLYE